MRNGEPVLTRCAKDGGRGASEMVVAPSRSRLRRIEPMFGPMPNGVSHIGAFEPIGQIWSGVAYQSKVPGGFGSVEAVYNVPNVGLPSAAATYLKSNKWNSRWDSQLEISQWVGFDPGTPALFQGGFDTGGSVFGTTPPKALPTSYAWWEVVFGGPWVEDWVLIGSKLKQVVGGPKSGVSRTQLSNFPVYPGDLVKVSIEKINPSVFSKVKKSVKGAAKFTYVNFTRGLITSFTLGATTPLVGQQVEWIVEAPTTPGNTPGGAVPAYGAVYFDQARCTFGGDALPAKGGASFKYPKTFGAGEFKPGTTNKWSISTSWINMTTGKGKFFAKGWHANEVVSRPVVLADDLIRLEYVLDVNAW
jgi:hypothetical protein